MKIQPLFKAGDKIFVTINNTRTEGEVIYYPDTPVLQYEHDDLGSSSMEDYSEYYNLDSDRRNDGNYASNGWMYAIHFDHSWLVYLVRLSTNHIIQVDEEDLVINPLYGVLNRSVHDFLSRKKTNGLKQYSELADPSQRSIRKSKVYLPDDVNKYITSFLPPPGKESLASHVNNRVTHTRKAAIREIRKEQKPEYRTSSEWWYDKWLNSDWEEDNTDANLEPKNDLTHYPNGKNSKPKFRPYTVPSRLYDFFYKKKSTNNKHSGSIKGGTRKVRKLGKMRKDYKR